MIRSKTNLNKGRERRIRPGQQSFRGETMTLLRDGGDVNNVLCVGPETIYHV